MKVFTAQQMRDFDRVAVEEYGIPSIVLMENAALRIVEFLEAKFSPLSEKRIVILCGKGNNGGDGLAIARHLLPFRCRVVLVHADPAEMRGDALEQWKMLTTGASNFEFVLFQAFNWSLFDVTKISECPQLSLCQEAMSGADFVVDALLGTGFQGELRPPFPQLLSFLPSPIVSVDFPSGVNADTGTDSAPGETLRLRSDYTVTFAAPKRGFFVCDGLKMSGEVWVGDIGSRWGQMKDAKIGVGTLDVGSADFKMVFLKLRRPIDAHKGDAGRALIIGGSFGMSGAVALASRAALNAGCGLCIAAMPEKILPTFAASILEATSHPLPCDESGRLLESAADELPALWKGVQVVALGPGISRSEEAQKFVARVVRECPLPLVIDADALHALPAMADEVKNRVADTILTPHPGEMGVLMGISAGEVNDARFETVAACAEKYGAIVVLKGARTLVATPDGRIFVNLTGNAGMATGGSGDVLTGTIAGLLAQLKNSEDATKLGVYLHGFAGDLAFEAKGNGLVAGDIAAHLGAALVEIPRREVERINGRLRKLM